MVMNIKIIFILFLCSLFIFSCKKHQPITISWGKEVFIQTDWVITSSIRKSNTTNPLAIPNNEITITDEFISDCDTDNMYRFNPDLSWEILPGPNNCGDLSTNPTREWAISEQGELLFLFKTTDGEIYKTFTYPLLDYGPDYFIMHTSITDFTSSEIFVIITTFESI